jgi:hypothetical protein
MKNPKLPAWMRSTRPDTIFKNCLNVQEGLVEPCDFDPAMCQACETTACKWHPSKLGPGRTVEDLDEEEDDEEEDDAAAPEDADDADADEADER